VLETLKISIIPVNLLNLNISTELGQILLKNVQDLLVPIMSILLQLSTQQKIVINAHLTLLHTANLKLKFCLLPQ